MAAIGNLLSALSHEKQAMGPITVGEIKQVLKCAYVSLIFVGTWIVFRMDS